MAFKVTAEREVFRGRVFTLKTKDVVLPNGRATSLNIIEHPGAVAIVPRFENGDVVLLRQFRLAAGGEIYEIPAGTLEPGESPRATAAREIVEETGFRARKLVKITEFYSAPGFCTEKMHLFVATGLTPATAEKDADEIIRAERVPFPRALRMIDAGTIRDAKSIVGLLLAGRMAR
jgi:ADP-ribose pyrophosphatase